MSVLSLFKKGNKSKNESQNHHFVLIEAPEKIVGPEIILWGEAPWWPKECSMRFTRKTIGKLAIGTEFEQQVVPVGPRWLVRVTKLIPDREIERTFLNGMFRGKEYVNIEGRYNGTKVNYVMQFEVKGLINQILWNLVFKKLHDKNIELILNSLNEYVMQKMKTLEPE